MKVGWSDRALRNLEAIYEYIHDRNPAAARRIHGEIHWRAERLSDQPNTGRPGRVTGTRELIVSGGTFIVAYRIQGDPGRVQILAVRHAAQLWPESFE